MKGEILGGGKVVTLSHSIRPSDLDRLGHVNNARALEFFELGRYAWMNANEIPYSDRIIAVVRRAELNYKREIRFESISIATVLTKQTFFEVVFHQTVLLEKEQVPAVEGFIHVNFLDEETRRPRRVVEFLQEVA